MRRLGAWLVIGACAEVFVLAGCSDSTSGNARPTATTAADGGGSSLPESPTRTTKPSGSSATSSPLSGINPCELLSGADRAQLGVGAGEPSNIGKSKACDWQKSGEFTVGIGLKLDLAFKDADLRGATPTDVNVGRHKAHQVQEAGGAKGVCEVFVETGGSSFAQVTVVGRTGTTPQSCGKAVAVAMTIDPKLP